MNVRFFKSMSPSLNKLCQSLCDAFYGDVYRELATDWVGNADRPVGLWKPILLESIDLEKIVESFILRC